MMMPKSMSPRLMHRGDQRVTEVVLSAVMCVVLCQVRCDAGCQVLLEVLIHVPMEVRFKGLRYAMVKYKRTMIGPG